MDEQIWDVHDLDDILDFSIDIIEFFKNDFLSIKIFLLQESVWDQQIMLKLSLSLNELKMNKHSMLKNMVMAYYSMVCESSMDPDKQIAKVDYPFITLLQRRINPIDIFVNENFCSTQMFRYYIELIKNRGSIKIDTYNNFQPEVMDFVSIYDTNYRKFKLNMVSERVDALDDKEIQDRYINFYRKIVKEAKDYIPTHFRDCVEEEDFINYLFSLYYTNLLDKQNKNEELDSDELQVMNSIENNKDLVEVFDFNPSIVILILEYLFNTYKENGLNYDKRQQVKDKKSRNYLRALDYNFDTKFDLDIIISDYTIDNKLTTILENFAIGKLTSLEIYQLLLDHMSIYDQLYQIGLDARGSDFYKILMIRKILSDVFEYESYLKATNKNYSSSHYKELKDMQLNWENLLNYFVDKGTFLIETYYDYHRQYDNFIEKTRLHIYQNNELKFVDKINHYSLINYFPIMLGKLKEMPSVDYINRMLDVVINGEKIIAYDKGTLIELNKMVQAMCLSVYEHLLLEDQNNKNVKILTHIIENETNLLAYLLNNDTILDYITMLFISYNKKPVSYDSEIKLREQIKDDYHIKMLKRINPFDNGDNNKPNNML